MAIEQSDRPFGLIMIGVLLIMFSAQDMMDFHRLKYDVVCQCEILYARNFTTNPISLQTGLEKGIYNKYDLAMCFKIRTPVLLDVIQQIKDKKVAGGTSSPAIRRTYISDFLEQDKQYDPYLKLLTQYLMEQVGQSGRTPTRLQDILLDV